MGPVQSSARIRRCLRARRVSSFTTCFVNTPLQRNLIPLFIKPRIKSSLSWLIIVMCFISMTSSRPRRSALAFSQALFSSAAQGAISFPSTISRRCLLRSMREIFSIASSHSRIRQGKHQTQRAVSRSIFKRRTRGRGTSASKKLEQSKLSKLQAREEGCKSSILLSHKSSQISSFVQTTLLALSQTDRQEGPSVGWRVRDTSALFPSFPNSGNSSACCKRLHSRLPSGPYLSQVSNSLSTANSFDCFNILELIHFLLTATFFQHLRMPRDLAQILHWKEMRCFESIPRRPCGRSQLAVSR